MINSFPPSLTAQRCARRGHSHLLWRARRRKVRQSQLLRPLRRQPKRHRGDEIVLPAEGTAAPLPVRRPITVADGRGAALLGGRVPAAAAGALREEGDGTGR